MTVESNKEIKVMNLKEEEMPLEERLRRIEFALFALMNLAQWGAKSGVPIPIGICCNATCGHPYHPHWDMESNYVINWNTPIIHSGRMEEKT